MAAEAEETTRGAVQRWYFIRFVPAEPNKGASNEYFLRWLRIDRSTPSPRRRAATIALQCRRFYSTWLRFSNKTQVLYLTQNGTKPLSPVNRRIIYTTIQFFSYVDM